MASTGPVDAPTVAHAGSQVGGHAAEARPLIAGGWARLNKLLNKRVDATSAVRAARFDLNSALPDAERGNSRTRYSSRGVCGAPSSPARS